MYVSLMTSKTQTTSIIALSALIVAFVLPNAFAGIGTVESYYWQSDTDMCYSESSLDNLNFEDSTGNGDDVIDAMELSRATFNSEMNGIDIGAHGWFSCFNNHFDVQSQDLGVEGGTIAQEVTITVGDRITQSEIRFDDEEGWGNNSNGCSQGDIDVEWVMNHEMGHGIGLKHHDHSSVNSMMNWSCNAKYSAFQSVDSTAVDIHYN